MRTVSELSQISGVSVRALHHYDAIGLLAPTQVTQSGYRLYDDAALLRLQMILLFRELEFPLAEIRRILDAPDFDRDEALCQQAELLRLKQERLGTLLAFVRAIQTTGVNTLDFQAFDNEAIEQYTAQAKAVWGNTDAYKEFEQKASERSDPQETALANGLMAHFAQLGALRTLPPHDDAVQAVIAQLQQYISANYYRCTVQILRGLGALYAGGGSMSENIDAAGGAGTAQFAQAAINAFCDARS